MTPQRQTNVALLDARARLRPMGVGDILDETFNLYRTNVLLFLATTLALLAPILAIVVLLAATVTAIGDGTRVVDLGGGGAAAAIIFVVLFVAGGIGALLVVAAVTVVASCRYLGQPITVRAAYSAAVRRLGVLLLAGAWAGLRLLPIIALSIFLIGYPFLIYYVIAWLLIPQAVMLEGCGAGGASKRSRTLVDGYWWRTLGLYLALTLLLNVLAVIPTTLLAVVIGAPIGIVTGATAASLVVYAVVGIVVPVLLLPLVLIATTLLFYDLKIRKEAFDLETMARQAVDGTDVRGKR